MLRAFYPNNAGEYYRFNPNEQLAFSGMGARRAGLDQVATFPLVALCSTGLDRLTKGTLAPIQGGVVYAPNGVLAVSLTGNGAGLNGQMALQALADLQNGNT